MTFLAVAQDAGIDFLPITWLRGLPAMGTGATAHVRETLINLQMRFAFKVVKEAAWIDKIDESQRPINVKKIFQLLISEISVLGHPSVKEHANIISLLGICWDIQSSGRVWPVLVFEKANQGDLWNFVTETCQHMELETKLKLCADVATAVRDLHQNSTHIHPFFSHNMC